MSERYLGSRFSISLCLRPFASRMPAILLPSLTKSGCFSLRRTSQSMTIKKQLENRTYTYYCFIMNSKSKSISEILWEYRKRKNYSFEEMAKLFEIGIEDYISLERSYNFPLSKIRKNMMRTILFQKIKLLLKN
jgi:hypothetical protein